MITPQGMREYYSEQNDASAYFQLKNLFENSDLWDAESTTERLLPDGVAQNPAPTFLEVIRKEDDENILSNLLGYFFEYSRRGFRRFASNPNLLNIPDMSASYEVFRETKERIDLWIESEKDIIVIENKIKSGINGIIREDYSQLNKYYKVAQKEAKCQGKRLHFYIFAPDYARFNLAQFGAEVEAAYKVIKYSDIYGFFVKEAETYITDRIFPDFLRSLKRHTHTLPELQFETMRTRLLRKINSLQ